MNVATGRGLTVLQFLTVHSQNRQRSTRTRYGSSRLHHITLSLTSLLTSYVSFCLASLEDATKEESLIFHVVSY